MNGWIPRTLLSFHRIINSSRLAFSIVSLRPVRWAFQNGAGSLNLEDREVKKLKLCLVQVMPSNDDVWDTRTEVYETFAWASGQNYCKIIARLLRNEIQHFELGLVIINRHCNDCVLWLHPGPGGEVRGGGGGYSHRSDARRKFLFLPYRGTKKGVVRALCDPWKVPKTIAYGIRNGRFVIKALFFSRKFS